MFLDIFELNKNAPTSPSKRVSYRFTNYLNLNLFNKPLITRIKWKAGRNASGRLINRTKTSLSFKLKYFHTNSDFRYLKMGLITAFNFVPFKNKILSLIVFSNGASTYFCTSENFKLFNIFYLNHNKLFKKINFLKLHNMIIRIKKLSFVSSLEIIPQKGSQYVLSPGSKSKIIRFDSNTHSALIELPSGIKKTFSYYSFVLLGRIANSFHSKCLNGKAGYWRSFGVNSIVRGVAKNPVDHPHGGRTKSIKYPRTPWGKTTKFK